MSSVQNATLVALDVVIREQTNDALEPARNQQVVVGGREVLMRCALERTIVAVIDGERRLVSQAAVLVDASSLGWQLREDRSGAWRGRSISFARGSAAGLATQRRRKAG